MHRPSGLAWAAAACACLAGAASRAQEAPPPAKPAPAALPAVTITGSALVPPADFAGFAGLSIESLPMQLLSIGEARLRDTGSRGVRDLGRFDASVGDAYNAVGYTDNLTVRGFVIDPRANYRRDGLPISAETSLAIDNAARLELLKGTSGMQAGTSAPGGLVNLVVKRPDTDLRSALVELRGAKSALAATDLSARFGTDRTFGLRLNAAVERLDPELRDARGTRHLLALAGDWRLTPDTLVELEAETGRRSQPSQPGFSLLGDRVPDARDTDPRRNLNDPSWAEPVVFASRYASLRLTQRLAPDWRAVLHAGSQRLVTDDRTAFPFGCSEREQYDRYCPDGRFDLYDYRSENERRRTDAVDAGLQGRLQTGPLAHTLAFGVLHSRYTARLEGQAFNFVGQGDIDGDLPEVAPDPRTLFANTDRTDRNTELYLRDAVQIGPDLGLWFGLRHTRLSRGSVATDGSAPTRYTQRFTTPWLAASWQAAPGHTVYASWGRGVETAVVPNLPGYEDAGQAQPARESRQTELGYTHRRDGLAAGLGLFRIDQPAVTDTGTRIAPDGEQVHLGLETHADLRLGAGWTVGGSAQWLRAERQGSTDPSLDGTRPPNVPARSLRLRTAHEPATLPGLTLEAALVAESDRTLLPGNERLRIGGWARIDTAARYEHTLASGQRLVWRAGIDNLADRRAWKEAPYQFDHVYLYPMAPRTWRLSLQADL